MTIKKKCNINTTRLSSVRDGGINLAIGDIIVGIDIGTTKVATVVGEVNNFGQIETICSTSYKCSGLKKSKIINEEEISLSLVKTIKDAEDETNLKINSAYVTIPGKYVTIVQNSITKEAKEYLKSLCSGSKAWFKSFSLCFILLIKTWGLYWYFLFLNTKLISLIFF